MQRVSGFEDDGRQEQKEEHVGPKHFLLLLERDRDDVQHNQRKVTWQPQLGADLNRTRKRQRPVIGRQE